MSEPDEELLWLTDEDGVESAYRPVGRIEFGGGTYAILEDAEDEGSVMVFHVETDEEGEVLSPLDDGDLCEEIFYYFEAEQDDYEVGPAE